MKSFAIKDGDIIFDGTDIGIVENLQQLAQEADISVGVAKGEWFLDEESGTSHDALYKKPFNESEFKTDVIEGLSGCSQQLMLLDAEFSKPDSDRKIRVDLVIKTVDGEILNLDELEVGV